MKIFKLPDLGEGLPDAQVREWYVKVGDTVSKDQPLVAMETAKALVDVPSPRDGEIETLFGEVGDTIETGHPLVGFQGEADPAESNDPATPATEAAPETPKKETPAQAHSDEIVKALPAVRMLAKQLNVDLNTLAYSGDHITTEDVKQAAKLGPSATATRLEGDVETFSGVRRAMILSMNRSHQEVVPVTLVDDADCHAWKSNQDITVRLVRAVQAACEAEPMLNAYFDGVREGYQLNQRINLGMAVDTPHGLYVPVLKDIANLSDKALRDTINRFKQEAQDRSIPQDDLKDATIILSNFGAFAGRYANPVIVPPMVSIIGVGRSRDEVVPENGQPAVHRIMPLSITADHRAVTGGEIARFLKAMIDSLEQPEVAS